jgi:hypothetical protein
MEFREFLFVPRKGIQSCLLFCGRVRNGISRDCFKFCFLERNSELLFLPRKGSEQNSESFLFHWIIWNVVGNNPLFRLFRFRGILLLLEIPNPTHWLTLIPTLQPHVSYVFTFQWFPPFLKINYLSFISYLLFFLIPCCLPLTYVQYPYPASLLVLQNSLLLPCFLPIIPHSKSVLSNTLPPPPPFSIFSPN